MDSTYKFYEVFGWIDPAGTTDLDFKKVDQVIPIRFMVVEFIIVISDMVMVLVFKMWNYYFRIQHYQGGDMNIHLQIFNSQVANNSYSNYCQICCQYGGGSQSTICHFNFKNDSVVDGLEFFEVGGLNVEWLSLHVRI